MNTDIILELKGISKYFPGVKALDTVDLKVKKGSVHGLLGENGAGKSTLMNIITGSLSPDNGEIIINGKKINHQSVTISRQAGIGLVHQEGSLLPYLDVKSNLFLGRFPTNLGFINEKELSQKTEIFLGEMGITTIKPETLVVHLSTAERQLVEIGKALTVNPKLLLLDEPTASLTEREVDLLFSIINNLKKKGVGVIYITHRLDEVFRICDEITIFRDGRHIITGASNAFTTDSLISNMVGRSINEQMRMLMIDREKAKDGEVLFEVRNLSKKGFFRNISFSVRRGEVLGLAGLIGAGRSSVLEAIFGCLLPDEGEIVIKGKKTVINNQRRAIKNKIAFIPEDRKNKGLSLIANVRDNIIISTLRNHRNKLLLSERKQNLTAERSIELLNIRTPSIKKIVGQLSGGNQQKVILARWLETKPEILLLDEPTHGIDVGGKIEIYKIIERLTNEGISVILASSEMTELLLLSDRIAVLYNGEITGFLSRQEATEDKILALASGEVRK
jgi:ABC-type sugar transport system ATPase subunit